ncbi:pilus assembly protein TadG-related protein [uncultured Maritimibacter sp.]|jgi:Flp pilus assembly protein TadG|uniref:pilus assembly protein TadG-related protein n=1 Tax=uncultured Maritimibacter sp. TaxID=991866 RepID=UPI002629611D|nr:pilus assembly protein TadG-related protein [uncultured Maritimibacter sp.]
MTTPRKSLSFRQDEDGAILVLFALMLAAFAGLVAMSYDFGQSAATQSELQSFSDNVALAAAGELDGTEGAINRARLAAATLIADSQTYGEGTIALGPDDYTLAFYATRPGTNPTPTTTDSAAAFVAVRVTPRTVGSVFRRVLDTLNGDDLQDTTVAAYSVAGFTRFACNVTPLMICAPSLSFDLSTAEGSTLRLHVGADTGRLTAGALAMLDPVAEIVGAEGLCQGLSGIGLDLCMVAAEGDRATCFADDGVDVDDSFSIALDAALNVPFDVFQGVSSSLRNNPLYRPASNVLSGLRPRSGQCMTDTNVQTSARVGLPLDDCQRSATCGLLGDGNWDAGRIAYVNANYGGTDPHPTAETRFDFYVAEVEALVAARNSSGPGGLLGGLVNPLLSSLTNLLAPTCSSVASPDLSRRVLSVAIVDCSGSIQAGDRNLPVMDYAEIFLMSPVGFDGTDEVRVEVIGRLGENPEDNVTGASVRNVVRLYD